LRLKFFDSSGYKMNKIRKGDQVIVLAGRDKGKRGVVITRVSEELLVVDGVNVMKKNIKPNPLKGISGGVVQKNMTIHQSNVAIYNSALGKADRVGIRLLKEKDGDKVSRQRFFKSSGELINT
jgi:large subunit ribosomal protein L24